MTIARASFSGFLELLATVSLLDVCGRDPRNTGDCTSLLHDRVRQHRLTPDARSTGAVYGDGGSVLGILAGVAARAAALFMRPTRYTRLW